MDDKMTDKEFILYCKTHCNTPRAAFVPAQIARLLRLAGREETAKEWDALDNFIIDNYRTKVLQLISEIEARGTKK